MSNPSEELAARWLGGRGTKVLYFAIILAIFGAMTTWWALADAREGERAALELVSEVQHLCSSKEFRVVNANVCTRAAEISGGQIKNSGPAGTDYVFVLDTPVSHR